MRITGPESILAHFGKLKDPRVTSTADVEMTLSLGVHGPKALCVWVVQGSPLPWVDLHALADRLGGRDNDRPSYHKRS